MNKSGNWFYSQISDQYDPENNTAHQKEEPTDKRTMPVLRDAYDLLVQIEAI